MTQESPKKQDISLIQDCHGVHEHSTWKPQILGLFKSTLCKRCLCKVAVDILNAVKLTVLCYFWNFRPMAQKNMNCLAPAEVNAV